ncbi:cytochrome b/b6 domain-containing protein [Blastomonas sp. AAP53]|uniref:cytochrome b/b6 domain-containing protein n=1 Tax=Blastomonas sp. AAP53 TaxID=1248760 RepID=UPI0002F25ED5|nr:cytochrome b/b6 domain-containing protein [Blastomonas sp. AAP53]
MTDMIAALDPAGTAPSPAPVAEPQPASPMREPDHRHGLTTRLWHWVNLVALITLFMSGLMIFNAHPRLYWGEYGNRDEPAWLVIGQQGARGYLEIGGARLDTTGVLARFADGNGVMRSRAFPGWATIPTDYNLADARHWHFFFAWIFAFGLLGFMVISLLNGHIRRTIAMRAAEWHPRTLWKTIVDHARFDFHTAAGEAYNPLQKLSYIAVIFVALPLMIVTGLAMSPGTDAALHWPSMVFGGRQSARSLHFILAFSLLGFMVLHVALVLLHRPLTLLRGMTIGHRR